MAWRKWIVRGIAYGIIGAVAAGALAYERFTNPGAVREQVIAEIGKMFPGAQVSIDSARLRILGGIQLNGLRLTRIDDAEKLEFLHVPSAIFYHDKEKVLEGELRLRKIELNRPRLRVRRARDGTWNLQSLVRKADGRPATPLPAIVIHRGTLILEDRADDAKNASIDINDVSLTLVNDPLQTVRIHGAANSDLIGKLQIDGSLDRVTSEAHLSFRATQIPLTHGLISRLPVPVDVPVGLQLQALAKIEGKVSYHPGQPQSVYYDVRCEVKDGKLAHPKLPLPLEQLNIKLRCHAGEAKLESLTASSGATKIEAQGIVKMASHEQDFEVRVDLKHVPLGEEFAARLPDKLSQLHKRFQPKGPMSIHIACARHEGQWTALSSGEPSHVSLRPEGVALAFKDFPYPLENTTGAVDYNIHNRHVTVDLSAMAGTRPVLMNGHWTGEGAQADVEFNLRATDVPIDEKLSNALRTEKLDALYTFATSFHPTGMIDVRSHIRQEPGKGFRNEYHIRFHDAAILWDQFPYPLKDVSGFLDIYHDYWEFHEFQGTHKGGHVMLNGKSIPRVTEKGEKTFGISLEITGRNIPLDDDLRDALRPMPGLHKSWETFRPQGHLYFTAAVTRPSADLNDLDVKVDAHGATVVPTFFPFRIQDVSGQFHFRHNALEIAKLRARHEKSALALDKGKVDLHPRGGYYADLLDVQVHDLAIDDEFVKALPPKLQTAAKVLDLRDPLKVKTRVVIFQPPETGTPFDVYWDAQVWMHNGRFTTGMEFKDVTGCLACIGRYNGRQIVGVDGNLMLDQATLFNQPFKNVHAKFRMTETHPDIMLVGLRAPLFGGDVTGQIRVDFNSALNYAMNLTASQINVAEFGRHNVGPKSQLSGAASARLYLTGFGSGGMDTLDGRGAIDIPRGHIYNLPFLLDFLKFLGLSGPDRTTFEEFHTAFSIHGSKVQVQKLDLLGTNLSLSGKGDFDLTSKKLDLDVYPMWGRIEQLLPPNVRPFPTTISKNLITVEVRGNVSPNPKDLRFRMKPVPVIIDPLLLLRDRVLGRSSTDAAEPYGSNVGVNLLPTTGRMRTFRIWD